MRVVNVGDIGNTYDCPTIGCAGETTDPAEVCLGCKTRATARRLPLVAEVLERHERLKVSRIPLRGTARPGQPLSGRELQLLHLLAEGLTNHDLAHELGITKHTIQSYVRRVLAKLRARNRAHAVALGFRAGLLQ